MSINTHHKVCLRINVEFFILSDKYFLFRTKMLTGCTGRSVNNMHIKIPFLDLLENKQTDNQLTSKASIKAGARMVGGI